MNVLGSDYFFREAMQGLDMTFIALLAGDDHGSCGWLF